MAGAVEAELKLTADDDRPLRALATAAALGRAKLGPARTVSELDVYLDTADGRLAAVRWACRLRAREGRRWISLKGPALHAPGEALHRRPEIDGPVGEDPSRPDGWPASAAREKVLELAGPAASLAERVALAQERTERPVTLDEGTVGTLSLDRVEVRSGAAILGTLRVVELELAGEHLASRLAEELLPALLAHAGLRPEPASKLEQALRLVAASGERA
jgi:inorganic triphosphatase YgiF